ncbi:hypothetical protein C8R43DRAFT_1121760 [Mycena crocata]|nr:hypothetical protein C8R43DRAFT_1121760 [Mycena crocata]
MRITYASTSPRQLGLDHDPTYNIAASDAAINPLRPQFPRPLFDINHHPRFSAASSHENLFCDSLGRLQWLPSNACVPHFNLYRYYFKALKRRQRVTFMVERYQISYAQVKGRLRLHSTHVSDMHHYQVQLQTFALQASIILASLWHNSFAPRFPASHFNLPCFDLNTYKPSFQLLFFGVRGRSGISDNYRNIEYTTYRRPASGLKIHAKTCRRPTRRCISRQCVGLVSSRPCSHPMYRGAAAEWWHIEYRMKSVPASGLKIHASSRLTCITSYPTAVRCVSHPAEPPRSGGGVDHRMYPVPASGIKPLKKKPPEANSRLTRIPRSRSHDLTMSCEQDSLQQSPNYFVESRGKKPPEANSPFCLQSDIHNDNLPLAFTARSMPHRRQNRLCDVSPSQEASNHLKKPPEAARSSSCNAAFLCLLSACAAAPRLHDASFSRPESTAGGQRLPHLTVIHRVQPPARRDRRPARTQFLRRTIISHGELPAQKYAESHLFQV